MAYGKPSKSGARYTKEQKENARKLARQEKKFSSGEAGSLPLYSSGYMDIMMEKPAIDNAAATRAYMEQEQLQDLGVFIGKNGGVGGRRPRHGDDYTPFGAWQQGQRAAVSSSHSRGFGTKGAMRAAAWEPVKQDIQKTASRARAGRLMQDRQDVRDWMQRRMMSMPGVASYFAEMLMNKKRQQGGE